MLLNRENLAPLHLGKQAALNAEKEHRQGDVKPKSAKQHSCVLVEQQLNANDFFMLDTGTYSSHLQV